MVIVYMYIALTAHCMYVSRLTTQYTYYIVQSTHVAEHVVIRRKKERKKEKRTTGLSPTEKNI